MKAVLIILIVLSVYSCRAKREVTHNTTNAVSQTTQHSNVSIDSIIQQHYVDLTEYYTEVTITDYDTASNKPIRNTVIKQSVKKDVKALTQTGVKKNLTDSVDSYQNTETKENHVVTYKKPYKANLLAILVISIICFFLIYLKFPKAFHFIKDIFFR